MIKPNMLLDAVKGDLLKSKMGVEVAAEELESVAFELTKLKSFEHIEAEAEYGIKEIKKEQKNLSAKIKVFEESLRQYRRFF